MEVTTASAKEVTTANTTEVTTVNAVVRLTVELPPAHAGELAKLLACHVNFADFQWAVAIYEALRPMDDRSEVVFADVDYGANVFLRRKRD